MNETKKGEVGEDHTIVRRVCTKEAPFRPGIDDDTHTLWEHEGAELDDHDLFWVCRDCGVGWHEKDL